MGYAYLSKGKKQGYKILIDEAMDISAVPGEKFFPGTEAVTADGATRYHLNNAHEWVEVTGDTPGGGWPEDLPLPSEGGYGYTDEDETVHKIDNKYLPEGSGLPEVSGSGKALISVNGEWKEMDGYGYSGADVVTLINETVTLSETAGVAMGPFSEGFELVPGDSYSVTIDGVEHKGLVAQSISDTLVRIMDGEVGAATFAVLMSRAWVLDCTFTLADPSEAGNHTVKVEHITAAVHKIDSKYIPESKELPDAPEQNGSYVLTCTVSDGSVTREWKATESAG